MKAESLCFKHIFTLRKSFSQILVLTIPLWFLLCYRDKMNLHVMMCIQYIGL